jgi:hypothetical protein
LNLLQVIFLIKIKNLNRGNLSRAIELFEKAIQLTRSEDSMNNLCSMLVGAKTQFKIISKLQQ